MLYPRKGWVYNNGVEKEMAGYRPFNDGYQVLLQTPAPRGGFLDYELVVSYLVGGEAVVNAYIEAMQDRGEEPFILTDASIDLLRTKDKGQIRIAGRSVFRRYSTPPARGYLNAPMQYLKLVFTDEPGVYWYAKSTLEGYHNRPWVESLLEGLYAASGIPPVDFVPLETRQRATRPRRRRGAFGTTNTTTTGTTNTATTGTTNTATTGTANIGAPQPTNETPPPPYGPPPTSHAAPPPVNPINPTPPPYPTPPPDDNHQPPPQPTNLAAGGSTVEERLSRLEAMITELLNAQRARG